MVVETNKVALDGAYCVIVYIKYVFGAEGFFFEDAFLKPPGAVGVAETAGRDAYRDGIE